MIGVWVFLYGVLMVNSNMIAVETCQHGDQNLMCPLCETCDYWKLKGGTWGTGVRVGRFQPQSYLNSLSEHRKGRPERQPRQRGKANQCKSLKIERKLCWKKWTQAFLNFCGFDFHNFWFNAVHNFTLFSFPLVLISNLDLGGFHFLRFFYVSPH